MVAKLIALIKNRAALSALCILLGTFLTAVYGNDFGVSNIGESLATVLGVFINMFGFKVALDAPTDKPTTPPTEGDKK